MFAHWPAPAGAPTVLIYGHYDVQPVDPLNEWTACQPFEPMVKGGKIWGRGTTDDKGQIWSLLKALETLIKVHGGLPVGVKLLFEGEEEVGSEGLTKWLPENQELLACDLVLVADTAMLGKGKPSITYGLRGLLYFQVEVTAAAKDLHSGSFGGGVANPINVLAAMIARLHDEGHRVTVPGFYDDVLPITTAETANYARLPEGTEELLAASGAPAAFGEKGFTTAQRITCRPTLDCNGIWGGFAGKGPKTVLPATAGMKISMRLVPNQNRAAISAAFDAYINNLAQDIGHGAVNVTVTEMHGGNWFICPLEEPTLQMAAAAMSEVFGVQCLFTREGGSIPIVADMAAIMGKPIILMGLGLHDENAHAPNEHFDLENFVLGIKAALLFFQKLASRAEA
jgi:acetylornithine deacetylase/succinyl-diaminopimelate desuccinylase-like protein